MDNVINLNKMPRFAVEGEMAKRIKDLISEYAGQVSVVSVIGVLEVVKHDLLQQNNEG